MADHISPTYATGTFSLFPSGINNSYYFRSTALTGSTVASGYVNVIDCVDAGSFNSDTNNMILSKAQVNTVTQQS